MFTTYHLNIAELRATLLVPEDTPEHVFHEMLRVALQDDRFKVVANLVHHLREEADIVPPRPPQEPITVPAVAVDPKLPVVQQPPPPMAMAETGNQAPQSLLSYPVQEEGAPNLDSLDTEESMPSSSYEQDNIIAHPQSELHKMAGVAEEQREEERLYVYNRECAANNLVSS